MRDLVLWIVLGVIAIRADCPLGGTEEEVARDQVAGRDRDLVPRLPDEIARQYHRAQLEEGIAPRSGGLMTRCAAALGHNR